MNAKCVHRLHRLSLNTTSFKFKSNCSQVSYNVLMTSVIFWPRPLHCFPSYLQSSYCTLWQLQDCVRVKLQSWLTPVTYLCDLCECGVRQEPGRITGSSSLELLTHNASRAAAWIWTCLLPFLKTSLNT